MKKNQTLTQKTDYTSICFLALCVLAALFITWTFTGRWPGVSQPYNSYILQAKSWLNGRLDLPENYSHLEIAIFEGKYYISFPPFPSYLMLPFVLLGWETCDTYVAVASAITAAVYAFKILDYLDIKKERAIFFSLFLTLGSNWLFTAQVAWVWFIAQNMAFTLSLMAIYYALKGKAGISLTVWACAVGCRPLQAFYIPVLLYLLYNQHMSENPDDKIKDIIIKKWICAVPMIVIASSYMALNFARFGNPIEFGHNYLPEFTEAERGQFNFAYIKENFPLLFKLPEKMTLKNIWEYQKFNGTNIFLISPIFLSFLIYAIYAAVKKKSDLKLIGLIFCMIILQLLAITAHKTMGGSQFGNRYPNDVLPLAFLGLVISLPPKNEWEKFNYVLFVSGFSVNLIGAVLYYNKLFSY